MTSIGSTSAMQTATIPPITAAYSRMGDSPGIKAFQRRFATAPTVSSRDATSISVSLRLTARKSYAAGDYAYEGKWDGSAQSEVFLHRLLARRPSSEHRLAGERGASLEALPKYRAAKRAHKAQLRRAKSARSRPTSERTRSSGNGGGSCSGNGNGHSGRGSSA
jgi:hypothetical protein